MVAHVYLSLSTWVQGEKIPVWTALGDPVLNKNHKS